MHAKQPQSKKKKNKQKTKTFVWSYQLIKTWNQMYIYVNCTKAVGYTVEYNLLSFKLKIEFKLMHTCWQSGYPNKW